MHPRTLAPSRSATALLAPLLALTTLAMPVSAQLSQCLPANHMGTVDAAEAHHVLNRLTFGPTTALLSAVQSTNGYQQFVLQQLAPNGIPENPDLGTVLGQLGLPLTAIPWDTGPLIKLKDIQTARIAHAMLSHRQLNAVMTEFWEDHFSTDWNRLSLWISQNVAHPTTPLTTPLTNDEIEHMQCWMEWTQNQMFRSHALGTFEDLIRELITSPAMMLYLDTVDNGCTATNEPNENFARELLELFTMGKVDQSTGLTNYDQTDIEKVAELLSGWRLVPDMAPPFNGAFPYHIAEEGMGIHCGGAQTLFGGQITIPAGNAASQRDALAAALANHGPVKDFICRKIVRQFIAHVAALPGVEDALLGLAKSAWSTNGNLADVMCALCSSTAFQGTTYRWLRVRSPIERVTWNARIWDSAPTSLGAVSIASFQKPWQDVADMGQLLFRYLTPDGFPQDSVERLGSSTVLEGAVAGADIYRGVKPAVDAGPGAYGLAWAFSQTPAYLQYVQSVLTTTQQASATAVARVILSRLYPDAWTAADQSAVVTALGTSLTPSNPAAYTVDLARGIAVAFSFTQATLK